MKEWYWLAINGASVSCSAMAHPATVTVRPIPEQLLGFRTQREAKECQKFLLEAPIEEVRRFMAGVLRRRIKQGEVAYIRPKNPEPSTEGPTMWLA